MFGAGRIRTAHLLHGMLDQAELRRLLWEIAPALKPLSPEQLAARFAELTQGSIEEVVEAAAPSAAGAGAGSGLPGAAAERALDRFAHDLTREAREGRIDPVLGRDAEIREVVDILMRRRQNNPMIVGEAGVGKTALVEGLALKIAAGEVPPALAEVRLLALDLPALQAGASIKGEFEKRLKQVIEEVQRSPEPIVLFIDEAHTLIGAGGAAGTGDAANLLKPALARGTLRTIAATTWGEYKKHIEKDPALTRRFQTVQVDEPDEERAVRMLRGVAAVLEKHHEVQLLDEAIGAAVRLSRRYIQGRQLPDKAVSVLDTACARVATSQAGTPAGIEDARRTIADLEAELATLAREARIGIEAPERRAGLEARLAEEKARLDALEARLAREKEAVAELLALRRALRDGASPGDGAGAASLERLRAAEARLRELQGERPLILPAVDGQAVASVVESWTGIPVGRMLVAEIDAVLGLEAALRRRVLGQDHALRAIAQRIQTARAGLRLERQMRARLMEPDFLVEALKVYLALVGRAPADAEPVQTWLELEVRASEPALAPRLTPHLAALGQALATLEPKPAADETLLEQARVTLARTPLAKRAYRALLARPEIQGLPPWRASEAAGPHATAVLVRRSGRPLGAPVAGILTHAAFHGVFLPLLGEAAREGFAENWVIGAQQRPEPTPAELARLEAEMLALYYDDAIAAWQGVLDDVTLVPLGAIEQAAEVTKALSGPSSPVKLLLAAIVAETRLAVPPPAEAGGADAAGKAAAAKALGALGGKVGKLAKLVAGPAAPAAPAEPPGMPVQRHFAPLATLLEGEGGAPPAIDAALASLAALSGRVQEALLAPNPRAKLAEIGPQAAAALARDAAKLPAPLGPMLAGIAQKVGGATTGALREQINAAWQGEVLPFCRTALAGRFPFARASSIDASVEDVARLFAPGGLVDGFLETHLAAHVDTTRRPWQPLQGVALAPAGLAALERARRIGSALFPTGPQPRVGFSLTPLDLDPAAASVTLDLDGQDLRYDHGPAVPRSFLWPGPGGTGIVRLSFAPLDGGPPVSLVREGAWSLFRLMQDGQLRGLGPPDVFELGLGSGRHRVRFRLKAASVENPFDLGLLAGFACPEAL